MARKRVKGGLGALQMALPQNYARGGKVDPLDVQPLHQRLHEPDEDILLYLMNQNAVRAQGQNPPHDWAGDLSGVPGGLYRTPYAEGGEVEEGQQPDLTDEQIQQIFHYLEMMRNLGQD